MPRNLNDSTAVTVLFMMVSGGEQDQARGLELRTAGVEREEQWGENTALRSSSADRTGAG